FTLKCPACGHAHHDGCLIRFRCVGDSECGAFACESCEAGERLYPCASCRHTRLCAACFYHGVTKDLEPGACRFCDVLPGAVHDVRVYGRTSCIREGTLESAALLWDDRLEQQMEEHEELRDRFAKVYPDARELALGCLRDAPTRSRRKHWDGVWGVLDSLT